MREAVGPLQEVTVCVGRQQWDVEHILICQVDTENMLGLCLDHSPSGHTTNFGTQRSIRIDNVIGDQPASRHRLTCRIKDILTQKHLM
ncbi:hypothetical protein D3C80_1572640 [compost metagenome]